MPDLITYARLISSEASITNHDINEVHKKKFLCLLGFPQVRQNPLEDD